MFKNVRIVDEGAVHMYIGNEHYLRVGGTWYEFDDGELSVPAADKVPLLKVIFDSNKEDLIDK